mmetsp:Transcript_35924/g.65895  ORF Transcript_35924/g.65895 Transcript_35924/m.65895 type:complete len:208 (+) Transcript_35924:785-1408(+)
MLRNIGPFRVAGSNRFGDNVVLFFRPSALDQPRLKCLEATTHEHNLRETKRTKYNITQTTYLLPTILALNLGPRSMEYLLGNQSKVILSKLLHSSTKNLIFVITPSDPLLGLLQRDDIADGYHGHLCGRASILSLRIRRYNLQNCWMVVSVVTDGSPHHHLIVRMHAGGSKRERSHSRDWFWLTTAVPLAAIFVVGMSARSVAVVRC